MPEYSSARRISPEQFADVLRRSTLGARRPVDDLPRLATMLERADLLVSAWEGDLLVGVARSVTDRAFCCYLSDLAVDVARQRAGIGRELIRRTRAELDPRCKIVLLAAPASVDYYPRLGFERHESCWLLLPGRELR